MKNVLAPASKAGETAARRGALITGLSPARSRFLARAFGMFTGSLLIAVSAQVSVPLFPVPVTLQTLAVLLIAGALGWRVGVGAVAMYLIEGAIGLPVFANGAFGAARLIGPTGGYLAGFVLAAALTGWLADRGWRGRYITMLTAMLFGDAIILFLGASWLAAMFGAGDRAAVFISGFAPFALFAALKSALAAALVPRRISAGV